MTRPWIALLAAAALALPGISLGADSATADAETPAPIGDARLSLYPGSLFAVPDPRLFTWNASAPGDNELLPRAFASAPPRVPHVVADFEPITLRANPCLDCHALEPEVDPPALPASHRTDFRRAPDRLEERVVGTRWQCLACHVSTSDAQPLRANSAAPR